MALSKLTQSRGSTSYATLCSALGLAYLGRWEPYMSISTDGAIVHEGTIYRVNSKHIPFVTGTTITEDINASRIVSDNLVANSTFVDAMSKEAVHVDECLKEATRQADLAKKYADNASHGIDGLADMVKTVNDVKADDKGNINLNVGDCKIDVEGSEKSIKDLFEGLYKSVPAKPTDQDGSGTKVFDTVSDMVNSEFCKNGRDKRVSTRGYHKKAGIGGATYDIWDIDEYRKLLGSRVESNKTVQWTPDNAGDHAIVGTNLAAVLVHSGQFWAGQLGLLDPVENEYKARELGVTHEASLEKAAEYVKRQIDFLHKVNGAGFRHILVLHIENGRYAINGTVFIPAGVFLCGGSDWGQTPCVEMMPMKNLKPGEDNIKNYYPKPGYPILKNSWEPNFSGTKGQWAQLPAFTTCNTNRSADISSYCKFKSFETDQVVYSDSKNVNTEIGLDVATKQLYAKISLKSEDGTLENIEFKKLETNEGLARAGYVIAITRVCTIDKDSVITRVVWRLSVNGLVIDEIVPKDVHATINIDRFGNSSDGNRPLNGSMEYPVLDESWPIGPEGVQVDLFKEHPDTEANRKWRYYPGTCSTVERPTLDYIDDESPDDANAKFVGFKDVEDMWRIRDKYDANDRTGFMFIWNSSRETGGIKPVESVYLTQYVGGASAITISNYETNDKIYVPGTMNPSGEGDLDPSWKPNYLRLINGYMTYGSGLFQSLRAERISTLIHRPSYHSYGDYYTDRTYIQDIECGIQRENDRFAIDLNGAGDAVSINNVSFPVNHPSKFVYGTFWPMGEYTDGPAKAIKFQTTAFNWPNWKSFVGTSTAGAEVNRIINGSVNLIGNRNITVTNSHFEFGNIIFDNASGNVVNCYFSQMHDANYPDIDTRAGLFNNFGNTVQISNCEFHRGYDANHWPDSKWNIICSPSHTIKIDSAYQGWALGGNESQEIAPTIGLRTSIPKDGNYPCFGDDPTVIELPGYSRWAPYIGRESTIVRGVLRPQVLERTLDGFQGIGDMFLTKTSKDTEFKYWWDKDAKKPYEFGTYYYNCQWLLDKGDITTDTLDKDFIPLGKNPSIMGKNPLSAEKIAAPSLTGIAAEPYVRPVLAFYIGGQSVPEGWMRFYRGKESGKYTHYVDIPAMSVASFDDNGSQMYMRDWIPFENEVDENLGTNMLPIQDIGNDQWFKINVRGGRVINSKNPPAVITGGYCPLIDSITVDIKGTNSTGGSKTLHRSVTTSWADPFDKDVYCSLDITGNIIDWNKEKITIPEGAESTIVRKASSTGNFDLILTYSDNTGQQYNIAKLKTGQSIKCVYSKGVWSPINWSGSITKFTKVITDPTELGKWFPEIAEPNLMHLTYLIDCDVKAYNAKGGEIPDAWLSLDTKAPIGKKITVLRPSSSKGVDSTGTAPYGWNRIVTTYNIDGKDHFPAISNYPGDSFTLVKTHSGWVKEDLGRRDEFTKYINTEADINLLAPVDGFVKMTSIFHKPIGKNTSTDMYVNVNPNAYSLTGIADEAVVRIQLDPEWSGNNLHIQLSSIKGVASKAEVVLSKGMDFAEFIWREVNPKDPTDTEGKFYLTDRSIVLDQGTY